MKRTTGILHYAIGAFSIALLAAELIIAGQLTARSQGGESSRVVTTRNPSGELRSIFTNGAFFDLQNPFFQSIGTNGRTCGSCHIPADGWTITPGTAQSVFDTSDGMDPLFNPVDGTNSPKVDRSSVDSRRVASSMLLNKGLIRVGIGIPPNAEFTLDAVDDPYGFAAAQELSLFRRPLPTTNLRFLTGIMWDGRESSPPTTFPISSALSDAENIARLIADLKDQANSATLGHAQSARPLTDEERMKIMEFELNIATAQSGDRGAGALDSSGAIGGPVCLAKFPFYVTINDVLGADHFGKPFDPRAMTAFKEWTYSNNPWRAQIARGAALFNTRQFDITDVGGINDDLHLKALRGTCTTCHDTPNVGNHSVAFPINIGTADAKLRTPDMPLYRFKNTTTGELVEITDPGRALITGRWKDIGKFKGPVLRGLAARAPYFHNGFAATIEDAINFYDTRFNIGLAYQEKLDLAAFLRAL